MARFRISSHGRLQDWVAVERGYFEDEGLDYELDVVVLPKGTKPVGKGWHPPAPVLVAEILSPSTQRYDRGAKLRIYAAAGVKEAWRQVNARRSPGAQAVTRPI